MNTSMCPSKMPWSITALTKQHQALIKSVDNEVVAVMHESNARIVVTAVNEYAKRLQEKWGR